MLLRPVPSQSITLHTLDEDDISEYTDINFKDRLGCSLSVIECHSRNGSAENNNHPKIAYILLRLPFGVANELNDYSVISESIFDLTNDVLRDEMY